MDFLSHFTRITALLLALVIHSLAWSADWDSSGQDKHLSVDVILERVKESKQEAMGEESVYRYIREAKIFDLKPDGSIRKKTTKTYQAYTDGSDQELLEINGKPASERDRAKDRAHNLERQQKFLHRQSGQDSEQDDLMAKNMDLFRDKFLATLKGEELHRDRMAYVIDLKPNRAHKLENRFVDRLMNEVYATVWVDKKEFRVSKLEMKLNEQVSFLGGFAGLLRDIRLDVHQKQLAPKLWVDDRITAYFDVRVFFKTYRFKMESQSRDFRLIEREK